MKKSEIMCASQFIEAARRDLGLELSLHDVHLGRLKFTKEDKQKYNGYVCFFAFDGNNQICYLNAFEGGIGQKVVCGVKDEDVVIYQEFKTNHTFRAKGSIEWYYGANEEGSDYQIEEDELRRQRKLAAMRGEGR